MSQIISCCSALNLLSCGRSSDSTIREGGTPCFWSSYGAAQQWGVLPTSRCGRRATSGNERPGASAMYRSLLARVGRCGTRADTCAHRPYSREVLGALILHESSPIIAISTPLFTYYTLSPLALGAVSWIMFIATLKPLGPFRPHLYPRARPRLHQSGAFSLRGTAMESSPART